MEAEHGSIDLVTGLVATAFRFRFRTRGSKLAVDNSTLAIGSFFGENLSIFDFVPAGFELPSHGLYTT